MTFERITPTSSCGSEPLVRTAAHRVLVSTDTVVLFNKGSNFQTLLVAVEKSWKQSSFEKLESNANVITVLLVLLGPPWLVEAMLFK